METTTELGRLLKEKLAEPKVRRSIDDATPEEWNRSYPTPSPLNVQVQGSHYKDLKIQPIEYIHANGIPFAEGNVIKYVTRWRAKGGIKDLEKAKHFLELLIELEAKP